MFISRPDAEKKYAISYTRLIQLEREGKLTPIDAKDVGGEYQTSRKNVRVVYEEAQVASLRRTVDTAFARDKRRDARVFEMLREGYDVPDIVMRTRLELVTVKRLRDEYVKEKGGFVVSGDARRLAREHGIDLRPDNYIEVLVRLLESWRGIKPPKDKLARLKVISDE